jgi:hypothetical protein
MIWEDDSASYDTTERWSSLRMMPFIKCALPRGHIKRREDRLPAKMNKQCGLERNVLQNYLGRFPVTS